MKGYIGRITFGVIALLLVIAAFGAFFEVNEGESAIVQRFGRIVSVYVKYDTPELRNQLQNARYGDVTIHPGTGLRFKIPFIDTVTKYSSKLTTYDTPARPVITSNKKQLIFDNNAQWRIMNP
ncbi:MAG: SPFH domain-containing protein, partial [Oscillospiraceae bacterium]|nr:SPFH domain-containing protein [Oscillospiraceae bacterium]